MPTLLATATAVEDNVLDTMKMAEDAVIRNARIIAAGLEPITKLLPDVPLGNSVPAPTEFVDHTFGFVDRLTANLRDFTNGFIDALSVKGEAGPPRTVRATPKAHAA
jgi:hypothetical protein